MLSCPSLQVIGPPPFEKKPFLERFQFVVVFPELSYFTDVEQVDTGHRGYTI